MPSRRGPACLPRARSERLELTAVQFDDLFRAHVEPPPGQRALEFPHQLFQRFADVTLHDLRKRTSSRYRPKIVGLVPQPFLLFSRPFVVDREPGVCTGKWLPLAFDGRSYKVVHKAASENLAACDISEFVLTLPKRVVEVPIGRLNTFVEKSDFLQRRSPRS